ncbi:MAG: acyltransferase [Acidimicrobiia bacterium]|nr:acyltransferase [Acidimicrobiia bacterium]
MSSDRRFAYQPSLDGLRALAVGAVLVYHLEYGWARGGFLGVDAFFVLSGYLITSLLLAEWSGTGAIDRLAFWIRRLRRLLPALLLVLAGVAVYAHVYVPASQLGQLRTDGFASLFYVQNWWLIGSGQSYFDLFAAPSPLKHTWSLAIEEQYYLVWPLVVLFCLRVGRGSRRPLVVTSVVGTVASVLAMAALYSPVDPSTAYYHTGARAHSLLVGGLLGLALERHTVRGRAGRAALHTGGLIAAGTIVWFWARVGDTDGWMYRGGFLAFALLVAAVIASAVHPGSPLRRAMSARPLVWIGKISYGLYLWHWPVLVLLTPGRTGLDGLALDALRVATTLAVATASYHAVELPIRRGALRGRLSWAAAPAGVTVAGVALAAATLGAVAPSTTFSAPADAATVPGTTPTTTPAARAPGGTVVVVGDSVAVSLMPGLEQELSAAGISLVPGAIPGCGVVDLLTVDDQGAPFPWSENCVAAVPDALDRIVADHDPDLVVWLSSWETADHRVDGEHVRFGTPEGDEVLLEAMERARRRLTAGGARLVMLTMPAGAPSDQYPDRPRDDDDFVRLSRITGELADRHADVSVVDLAALACPGGPPCEPVVDGVRLRPEDGRHYSPEGAAWTAARVVPEIVELLPTGGPPAAATVAPSPARP